MKLFLDANVIVAVLNREYPLFDHAARVLSLSDRKNTALFISPVSVAIAHYFSSKKSGEAVAKQKIEQLLKHIKVSQVDHNCVQKAIADPQVIDLEDGIQYYSALHEKCECIITENLSDFHFSKIPVFRADDFLKQL